MGRNFSTVNTYMARTFLGFGTNLSGQGEARDMTGRRGWEVWEENFHTIGYKILLHCISIFGTIEKPNVTF